MAAATAYTDMESKAVKNPERQSTAPTATTLAGGFVDSKFFSWLPAISFAFMIYSSGNAIIQSKGDSGTIVFVVGCFTLLGGLFWCMREFERTTEKASAKKGRLKLAIWVLAMALNALFSYRVTTILDSTIMSITVWTIAAFTAVTGCYFLFFYQEPAAAATSATATKLSG